MKIKEATDIKAYLKGKRTRLHKTIKDVMEEIQKILENIECLCYDLYILECNRSIKVPDVMLQSKTEESTPLGLCKCSDELTHLKPA